MKKEDVYLLLQQLCSDRGPSFSLRDETPYHELLSGLSIQREQFRRIRESVAEEHVTYFPGPGQLFALCKRYAKNVDSKGRRLSRKDSLQIWEDIRTTWYHRIAAFTGSNLISEKELFPLVSAEFEANHPDKQIPQSAYMGVDDIKAGCGKAFKYDDIPPPRWTTVDEYNYFVQSFDSSEWVEVPHFPGRFAGGVWRMGTEPCGTA